MTTEQDEFWGDEAGWSASPTRDHTTEHPLATEATPARGVGRKASQLWGSLLATGSKATRAHASNSSGETDHQVATDLVLDTDNEPDATEHWDDGWDVEPAPVSKGGVDPLLAKFGGAAVVLTLLIPVAIGFRSGSDEQLIEAASAASSATLAESDNAVEPATTTPPAVATPSNTQVPAESNTDNVSAPSAEAETEAGASSTVATRSNSELSSDLEPNGSAGGNIAVAAEAAVPAVRVEPECPIEYEVVVGDFWIRIADGSGVPISELLALNGASSGTPLYPGSSVCLPAGSGTPPPPPSTSVTAPASTSPATTAAPKTAPPTTAPPTTAPPTTAAPAPAAPADIEEIIRYVWPDELEERALKIAWRESNYVPTAKNYCCYGLFQIYWEVHSSWLGDIGITSASQLYDPATNARAAYALYQRAGGWGPWGG